MVLTEVNSIVTKWKSIEIQKSQMNFVFIIIIFILSLALNM